MFFKKSDKNIKFCNFSLTSEICKQKPNDKKSEINFTFGERHTIRLTQKSMKM